MSENSCHGDKKLNVGFAPSEPQFTEEDFKRFFDDVDFKEKLYESISKFCYYPVEIFMLPCKESTEKNTLTTTVTIKKGEPFGTN